jgi:hypothetical protein
MTNERTPNDSNDRVVALVTAFALANPFTLSGDA